MSCRPVHQAEPADRHLALDLLKVTESAALAAAHWVGRADKNRADQAAVDAMRTTLRTVPITGTVVIGEGEKDDAPMLYNGEIVGDGTGAAYDVAVDPIDGTTLTGKGLPGAVAVLAVAPRGSMFDPAAVFYMDKLVTGRQATQVVDIQAPVAHNVRAVAKAKGIDPSEVRVCMLDRPRHERLAQEVREAGARVRLVPDGDVVGAVLAARDGTGVDLLLGIGGTPEGVVSACAIKCLGGTIQGRLSPQSQEEAAHAVAAGHDLDRVLTEHDLVSSDDTFFVITAITDTDLLGAVRYERDSAVTDSLVLCSRGGAVRRIRSEHPLPGTTGTHSSVNTGGAPARVDASRAW